MIRLYISNPAQRAGSLFYHKPDLPKSVLEMLVRNSLTIDFST